jgi:molecular chaperone GrpE (heat shock protein)
VEPNFDQELDKVKAKYKKHQEKETARKSESRQKSVQLLGARIDLLKKELKQQKAAHDRVLKELQDQKKVMQRLRKNLQLNAIVIKSLQGKKGKERKH